MYWWCCGRTVMFFVWVPCWFRMWAASPGSAPGDAHLVDCLVLLAAMVLPAPASPSVTKLLVSCVLACFTQLGLILTWPSCETAMCSFDLYPSGF
jgi:hypothetical protein